MVKKYKLKNCFGDVCELKLEMRDVKYIFKQIISGDDVFLVIYKNGEVKKFDSDMHFRCSEYYEGFEMIYPENIDLNIYEISPDEENNFICVKKGEE